jgi:hypothetical protein
MAISLGFFIAARDVAHNPSPCVAMAIFSALRRAPMLMSPRDVLVNTLKTLAQLALVSAGNVAVSVLTFQFLKPIGEMISWPTCALCVIGLVYVLGRSGAFKSLGWPRYLLFVVPALAIANVLFFIMIGVGMSFFHWEPF